MEYYIIHLVALLGMLIPVSIQDVCHRSVSAYLIWAGYAASCTITSYGIWQGTPLIPGVPAALVGVGVGLGLVVMARHNTILIGEADGHLVAICSILVPWHDDTPIALVGITFGCVLAAAYYAGSNLVYNMKDIMGGRPVLFDVDIFMTHRKRRGERFTISNMQRRPSVDSDGIMHDGNKDAFFERRDTQDTKVYCVIPLALYIMVGVFVTSAYVYLF